MKECIAKNYHELDTKASVIYNFVTQYHAYIKEARDYGTGEMIHMAEVHTLTLIDEHPGITVTEVALEWNRTKGAASQIVSKLEKRELIERKKEDGNAKTMHLYTTEAGKKLSDAHKRYDINELSWALETLRKDFSDQEINHFYQVMERYTSLLNEKR